MEEHNWVRWCMIKNGEGGNGRGRPRKPWGEAKRDDLRIKELSRECV